MLELRILGPIEVVEGATHTSISSSAARRLLARLALGGPVGVDREVLSDDLAVNDGALRTAVSRLRGTLGGHITLQYSRYVLDDVAVDADRFERLVANQPDDAAARIAILDEALALWRGEALEGVAHEHWAQPTATRLAELRASARLTRAQVKLEAERFVEALAEARALTVDYPLRDEPRAIAIEALANQGRRTEALRFFQDYRRYLLDEVGTEPGPALVRLDATIAAAHEPSATSRAPSNLPQPRTSLIGRETDISTVVDQLQRSRLVTLTGVGGVGKTRLAVSVAERSAEEYPAGTWFIDLAAVEDPSDVPAAVASQLGIAIQAPKSVTDNVVSAIAHRRVLLILDNCEHVLDAIAEFASAFITGAPSARLLATSREPLHVEGEATHVVAPLDTAGGATSPAVALLTERALAVDPSFTIDADQQEIATEICQRLDGIALAIELAAARLSSIGLADVRDRLDDRFRLLSIGRRGIERHKTLRHALQWSYELLTETECEILRRCTVFAGGFDLPASEYIAQGVLEPFEVVDVINSLVQKSLLTSDRAHGRARFNMLETVRLFAAEQLQLSASALEAYSRYCTYFAEQCRRYMDIWFTPRQPEAFTWFDREFSNLRSAYRAAVNLGRIDDAVVIATRAVIVGTLSTTNEPVDWCEELVPLAEAAQIDDLVLVYAGSAQCSMRGDGLERAVERGRRALELAVAGDRLSAELCVGSIGLQMGLIFQGRFEEYREVNERFSDDKHDRLLHFRVSEVFALCMLKRHGEARQRVDDLLAATRQLEVPSAMCLAEYGNGLAFGPSDPDRAIHALRRGLEIAASSGNTMYEGVILRDLARLEATHGSRDTAVRSFVRILDAFDTVGQHGNLTVSLGYLSMLFTRLGKRHQAAQLLASTMSHPGVIALMAGLGDYNADDIAEIWDDEDLAEDRRIGETMDLQAAVSYARRELTRVLDSETM